MAEKLKIFVHKARMFEQDFGDPYLKLIFNGNEQKAILKEESFVIFPPVRLLSFDSEFTFDYSQNGGKLFNIEAWDEEAKDIICTGKVENVDLYAKKKRIIVDLLLDSKKEAKNKAGTVELDVWLETPQAPQQGPSSRELRGETSPVKPGEGNKQRKIESDALPAKLEDSEEEWVAKRADMEKKRIAEFAVVSERLRVLKIRKKDEEEAKQELQQTKQLKKKKEKGKKREGSSDEGKKRDHSPKKQAGSGEEKKRDSPKKQAGSGEEKEKKKKRK